MQTKEQILANLKILICDNDVHLSNRLYIWLSGLKIDVHLAHNHDDAIDIFTQVHPDIIITSAMENREGLALIKAVKSFDDNAGIVFIFKDESADLFKEVITLNVENFIHTPVETSVLLQQLYRVSKERVLSDEYEQQEHLLREYKGAIDKLFIVSIHNLDGEITYTNDAFCKVFNIDKSSALDGHINPILHGPDNKQREAMFIAIKNKQTWHSREHIFVNKVNEYIFDVNVIPILNAQDTIMEYLVLMNDVTTLVTEGRKAQVEKENAKIEKLQMLRKHHQEVNRVKDSFLTVFAHELRTPLNAIINFSDHLYKHIAKSDIRKKVQLEDEAVEIRNSGLSILEMINNMIDAIKLRDKKMSFVRETFNLAACINEKIASSAFLEGVSIESHLDENLVLYSDETRFAQVLEHLLSNAAKYGNNKICVTLESKDDSFFLSIEDNGAGFEDVKHIFELFEQAEQNDMTRSAKGLGIGLFVVKQICMNLDMKITIMDSETLGGAKVVISENINEVILD